MHFISRTALLLKPRVTTLQRAILEMPRAHRVSLTLFVLACIGLVFFSSRWLFSLIAELGPLTELVIRRLLTITLNSLCLLLGVSAIVISLAVHFMNDRLPSLFTSPTSPTLFYFSGFIEVWAQSSWVVLLFGMPIFCAAGSVLSAPPLYFFSLPLFLLILTLIASAGGSLLALLLAHYFSARRLRESLIILVVITFLILYGPLYRSLEELQLFQSGGLQALVGWSQERSFFGNAVTPPYWSVEAMFALIRLDYPLAGAATIRLVGVLFLSLSLLGIAAMLCYRRAYQQSTAQAFATERSRPPRYPRGVLRATAHREFLLFIRDPTQWTQLLLITALVFVYLFNLDRLTPLYQEGLLSERFIFNLHFTFTGLILTTLCARFLYPMVSQEGSCLWQLQCAPRSLEELLRGKLLAGLLPLAILSLSLSIFCSWRLQLPLAWVGLLSSLTLCASVGLAGVTITLGALWPRFDLASPAQIAGSLGGMSCLFFGALYTLLLALIANGVMDRLELNAPRTFERELSAMAGLAGAIVLSLAPLRWGIRWGARQLAQQISR